MRITRYIAILCLLSGLVLAQHVSTRDVLYTTAGEELRGELERITDSQVFFKTPDGERVFERNDVVRVELAKKRPGDWWQTTDDIDDPVLSEVLKNPPDPSKFAGASYVVLYEIDEFDISLDGTVEHFNRRIVQAYDERSKDEVSLSYMLYFGDLGNAEFLYGRSISPSGSILHLDDSAIESGPVNAYTPNYNRLSLVKCALGEVGPGSIVDVARKKTQRYENSLDAFFDDVAFREEGPILSKKLVLKVEAGVPIHYAAINWPSSWPKPTLSDEGKYTVFTWSLKDIPPIIAESYMPPTAKYVPSLVVSADAGWDAIEKEFAADLAASNDDPTAIDELAKRLTKGAKTPEDKAKKIYKWVVGELRLIDVPAPYYSFVPKRLSSVLENQFANDLDKAALFYFICKSAGVAVDFGFASQHDRAFSADVPALASVPVPVLRIDLDGRYVWAELSSEYRPMGVLPPAIMGEKAVVFGKDGVEMTSVPLPRSNDEHEEEFIEGEIDKKGNLEATLRIIYSGSRQEKIRGYKQSSEKEIGREMEKRIGEIHPNAEMTGWKLKGIDDLDAPVEMIVEFTVDGYAITAGDKFMAFKIPDLSYSAWGTGKPSRDWPIWFDSPYRGTHDVKIELPKGYDVYYIPNDTLSSADSISYSASFSHKKRSLAFFDDYDRARLSFPPEMYPAYRDYRHVQTATAGAWIVLSKK